MCCFKFNKDYLENKNTSIEDTHWLYVDSINFGLILHMKETQSNKTRILEIDEGLKK